MPKYPIQNKFSCNENGLPPGEAGYLGGIKLKTFDIVHMYVSHMRCMDLYQIGDADYRRV